MSPGGGSTPAVSGTELRAQLVLPFLAVAVFQNPYALPSWERCKEWEISCDLPSRSCCGQPPVDIMCSCPQEGLQSKQEQGALHGFWQCA